jgi:hypothetical protein
MTSITQARESESGRQLRRASLRFPKLFFQNANEVAISPWSVDRQARRPLGALVQPAASIPAGRYCRPIIGYWRVCFVMEDHDLAVALPQLNIGEGV